MSEATPSQARLLEAVRSFWAAKGYGPSYRELGAVLGIRSTNGIAAHVRALVGKGLLKQEPGTARSVRVAERGARLATSEEAIHASQERLCLP